MNREDQFLQIGTQCRYLCHEVACVVDVECDQSAQEFACDLKEPESLVVRETKW